MTRKERQQRQVTAEPPAPAPESAIANLSPSLAESLAVSAKMLASVIQGRGTPEELSAKIGSAVGDSKQERSPEIELLLKALRIAGSTGKLAEWIQTPVPALDGQTPYALMQSAEGRKKVDAVLGRIEHGVY